MGTQKAKYEEIIDWLKSKIMKNELKAGSKIYSENELADIFKVSRQTVRHAVSVLENEGILERRRGSGTYIASEPEKMPQKHEQGKMRIAMITTYVDEYIFPSMIKKVEERLSKAGYTLEIAFTYNAVEKERMILKKILRERMIDGLIVETTKSGIPNPNIALYKELEKAGIPFMFINSYYPELSAPYVCMDDEMAGNIVTKHLLECGHRKIGAIFKCDDGQGHRRYQGYMNALMKADIKIKGERIAWVDTEELRTMKEDAGRIMKRLSGCTACVCYNDEVANKLVGIFLEQGIRIPQDFSVVGIDDSDLASYCEIPLTSAVNPIEELGKTTAEMMLRLLAGEKNVSSVEVKPRLEIRSSVRMIDCI